MIGAKIRNHLVKR